MKNRRKIEIDLEVYKLIEIERRTFSESHNEILRRILNLDTSPRPRSPHRPKPKPAFDGWIGHGVTLANGTLLRMEYGGRVHTGEIRDGAWRVEGKRFSSPSAAAKAVARTKLGTSPSLNGWIYWHVKRPGDTTWVLLKTLRDQAERAS